MRHRLLHALIAAITLAWAPAGHAGTVTIAAEGSEPATLDIAALQASWDVRDRPYTVAGSTLTVTGISMDRALDIAGVDPFDFTGATVAAGNRTSVLAREQLTDPAAFPDGRPVFYPDATGVSFLRPRTGDADAGELLSATTLTVNLTETSRLDVSASASQTHAEVGDRIAFSATVDGAAAGEDVRVRWTFDDRNSATGSNATHRFRRPGTYKVVVGASTDADPAGAAAVLTIRIGDSPEGPDRIGGGTNPDAAAPDSGASTASAPPKRGGGQPDAKPARTGRRRAHRDRDVKRPERPRSSRHRPTRQPRAAGERVTGRLVDPPTPDPRPTPTPAVAARTGDPDPRDDLTIPPAALGALAAAALLAIGAWLENRGVHRTWPDSTT